MGVVLLVSFGVLTVMDWSCSLAAAVTVFGVSTCIHLYAFCSIVDGNQRV